MEIQVENGVINQTGARPFSALPRFKSKITNPKSKIIK